MAGKVGGTSFTFKQAETDSFLSDATSYFLTIYPSPFTSCDTFAAPTDVNTLLLIIPKTAGSYNVGLSQSPTTATATFYTAATSYNRIATQGRLMIDSVTATTITGGASIAIDSNNTVDGQFQATICP